MWTRNSCFFFSCRDGWIYSFIMHGKAAERSWSSSGRVRQMNGMEGPEESDWLMMFFLTCQPCKSLNPFSLIFSDSPTLSAQLLHVWWKAPNRMIGLYSSTLHINHVTSSIQQFPLLFSDSPTPSALLLHM